MKKSFLIILLTLSFIAVNISKIITENPFGQTIFPLQKDLTIKNELSVINYTYESAGGMDFSISTLTSPLYVNTLWSYLYNWHGVNTHGYLPGYIGKNQIGQLGDNLINPSKDVVFHFYIIEPTYGIPENYVQLSQGEVDSYSDLLETREFGEIIVQKRRIKSS